MCIRDRAYSAVEDFTGALRFSTCTRAHDQRSVRSSTSSTRLVMPSTSSGARKPSGSSDLGKHHGRDGLQLTYTPRAAEAVIAVPHHLHTTWGVQPAIGRRRHGLIAAP